MTTIINTGRVPLPVGVIQTTTGMKGTVRIMGRGRGTLAAGYTIDPNWMALYGADIKLVENTPVVSTIQQPTQTTIVPTQTSAPTVATKGATA